MRLLAVAVVFAAIVSAADGDGDGLDDQLEQMLLERFSPQFYISPNDCDILPAEFRANSLKPEPLARNGVIYGQVFPQQAETVEIHYYHLWTRDCGRAAHPLDAEHVAALVKRNTEGTWQAQYWYAAAHEGTVCDASTVAHAKQLNASEKGPRVWVSQGKHASFFTLASCARGCGADSCEFGRTLRPPRIINIGERDAALNGALWSAAMEWPLNSKMSSDFSEETVSAIDSSGPGEPVLLNPQLRRAQAVVAASGTGASATSGAMGVGKEKTGHSISTGARHTKRALATAWKRTIAISHWR